MNERRGKHFKLFSMMVNGIEYYFIGSINTLGYKWVYSNAEDAVEMFENVERNAEKYGVTEQAISQWGGDIMEETIKAHAEALNTIDDMVDVIGKQIIRIAYDNRDFICCRCFLIAYALFGLMEKYAREEDTEEIRGRWKEITGADIREWR